MPSTCGRRKLIGKIVPPKGWLIRFHSSVRPMLPARSVAPITATVLGAKSVSSADRPLPMPSVIWLRRSPQLPQPILEGLRRALERGLLLGADRQRQHLLDALAADDRRQADRYAVDAVVAPQRAADR